jgi:predicted ATPase
LTRALERAEQQDALFWSLRVAVSVAYLKVKQCRSDNARQILEPVYARFTESFQTPDLRLARSMLETLGRAQTLVALPVELQPRILSA